MGRPRLRSPDLIPSAQMIDLSVVRRRVALLCKMRIEMSSGRFVYFSLPKGLRVALFGAFRNLR